MMLKYSKKCSLSNSTANFGVNKNEKGNNKCLFDITLVMVKKENDVRIKRP